MGTIGRLKDRILKSSLVKDSIWAMFGNGFGNALLLLAGILIARFLGKDLYGEYGFVKSTMFYIAAFATLGLGYTSTKFVAEYMSVHKNQVKQIVYSALKISLSFSTAMAVFLCIFAHPLSVFLNNEQLVMPFRVLGILIIIKSLGSTLIGVLGGFHDFRGTAIANISSGMFMLASSIPLTYYCGLEGAFVSLISSQIILVAISLFFVVRELKTLPEQEDEKQTKMMLTFSIPVALQESSYLIAHWGATILLTKLASLGEVGIYSACAQWNSVVCFIPTLLSNVVLSHLSSTINNVTAHKHTVKVMLTVNVLCTLLPFIVVYILSNFIASFYGPTFTGMVPVLRVMVFTTILTSMVNVLHSELLSSGRNWVLFTFRCVRDISALLITYLFMVNNLFGGGALSCAWASVYTAIIYFSALVIFYRANIKRINYKD